MTAWMDMRPTEFGKATTTVAEPLFAAPEALGTPDLLTTYEEPETVPTTDQPTTDQPADVHADHFNGLHAGEGQFREDCHLCTEPRDARRAAMVEPSAPDDHDPRFTIDLLYDVVQVLKAHGYKMPEGDSAHAPFGNSLVALGRLVRAYEGGEL